MTKLAVVSIAVLAGQGVLASWDQMKTEINELMDNSTMRSLTKEDLALLDQYGCWCYFEEDHGQGRGKPINEIDAHCKVLHDGYACAIMDGETEGFQCTPWTVQYNSATGLGFGVRDTTVMTNECTDNNPGEDQCAARACMIEGLFVLEAFSLFSSGFGIDPAMRHSEGFDRLEDCPINSDPALKSEKECCGTYPIRHTFKTYGGERGCCGVHTYNSQVLTCCADGSARLNC